MKILYAVQATGNGHIARATELLPYLQQYGTVDIFLSGSNSSLQAALPVTYTSNGLSLFYHKNGGLAYRRMLSDLDFKNAYKEAKDLPVEKYDIVINDFESITALACKIKKVASVGFGHQASFQSMQVPRPPVKRFIGELILKRYAPATTYVGLHFERYDDFIFSPVLKKNILHAQPADNGHVTVYLPHYADEVITAHLRQIKDMRFQVFSKQVTHPQREGNIDILPVDNHNFTKSMISSTGVITGAGFETPAEALYLGKKLMCIPIKGQYEQLCNAAALEKNACAQVASVNRSFTDVVCAWLNNATTQKLVLYNSTGEVVEQVIARAAALRGREKHCRQNQYTTEDATFTALIN
ncbi:glycosyl transferase [Panacibacter sp. DH6]|uniref:Glycosyl transferase n=1 Tax=Panacibacter microcysteis TaxID=2793269 RepID=A0A931E5I3_9BACT|nr:glycosyltransferase family protein [Panacibacter microcysteis]MBG9375891.1 glycosyl transferase [Panacibacter microcysteis]